jgi:hypothetical protein
MGHIGENRLYFSSAVQWVSGPTRRRSNAADYQPACSAQGSAEEAADVAGDGVQVAFQGEVAGVEEVDLGVRQIALEGAGAVGSEDLVVGPQTASRGT